MTDQEDQNEEVVMMSEKFENISTSDSNLEMNSSIVIGSSSPDPPPQKMIISATTSPSSSCNEYEISVVPKAFIKLPNLKNNLPEKIIFIIDIVNERNSSKFKLSSGTKSCSTLTMIKHAIKVFISLKQRINQHHEFALMVLTQDSADWMLDFTSDKTRIFHYLDRVQPVTYANDTIAYDLSDCIDQILHKVELNNPAGPPTHVIRTIMIYSRSHCQPCFQRDYLLEELSGHELFNFDILYVHDEPTEDNSCEEIYKALVTFAGKSYILEVGKNATLLHNFMAMLLAHPWQRPNQKDVTHSLFDVNTQKSDP